LDARRLLQGEVVGKGRPPGGRPSDTERLSDVPGIEPARSLGLSRFRTRLVAATVFAAACFGLSGIARADTLVITRDFNNYTSTGQFGQGGEWGISSINGLTPPATASGVTYSGNVFQSFCLERNETLSPGTYTWELSNAAHNGGVGGATNGSDPISAATAYLFGLWWNGQLTDLGGTGNSYNYSFGSGRISSALELQNAIWYLEGELTSSQMNQNSLGWAWAQAAISAAGTSESISAIGNVRVLTLTDSNGGRHQDILVLVPLPPAAAIGLGLMSAMGVVGLIRRRKQRTNLA